MKKLLVFVALLMVSPLCAATPLKLNLTQSFADTKAVIAAGGQAKIMMIGDSLENNVAPLFQQYMQQAYGNAGAGYQSFSRWASVPAGFDGGWTLGAINGDNDPHQALDGLWASTPARTTASFQQINQTIQLQYLAQPGGGSFTPFYWPTGPITTIDTNSPTRQIRTWNYTAPADYATDPYWILANGTGTVTILGQENVTPVSGVRVDKVANGGWGVNNYLQRDNTFDLQMKSINPDLVTVWLGQNDQAFDRTSYTEKMQLLLNRVKANVPNAEVVFIGTYDQGSPNLRGLVDAMGDVAQTNNIGFINLYDTAGNSAFMLNHGYLQDGIHFSPSGSAYMGDFLFQAFRTDGANLTPEPSVAFGLIACAFLLRRSGRRA